MSVSNNPSLSAKTLPDWLQNHPILIMSLVFLIGLLMGMAGNALVSQRGAMRELASIRAEIHRSGRTIDKLTGYEKSVAGTNTLLEELRQQKQSLISARQDLRQVADVNRQLRQIQRDLAGAGQASNNLASLVADLNEQTSLARSSAKNTLATMQDLQVLAIDQQFALPELQNALIAQNAINQQLRDLNQVQPISARSLDAIAANQNRIMDLSTKFEESFQTVDQFNDLLARQDGLREVMSDFDQVLNTAEWLAADARQIQNRLDEQRSYHDESVQNLDDLIWISQYLSMQRESLDQAQESLTKIDEIKNETVRLEKVLGEMVDVVELVTGVNAALESVSNTAVNLRQDLAEIVLLQPAVKQIYAEMKRDVEDESQPRITDARKRAEALISARQLLQQPKEVMTSSH